MANRVCVQCGAELTKKQAGESISQVGCYAPVGFSIVDGKVEKGPGSFDWAMQRSPLCGTCLAQWLINRMKPKSDA